MEAISFSSMDEGWILGIVPDSSRWREGEEGEMGVVSSWDESCERPRYPCP